MVAYQGRPSVRCVLPLSITFDHCVVTGGEAARFMVALKSDLERTSWNRDTREPETVIWPWKEKVFLKAPNSAEGLRHSRRGMLTGARFRQPMTRNRLLQTSRARMQTVWA